MADYSEIKHALIELCHQEIDQKIHRQKAAIDEAQLQTQSETKSSFGDKYETDSALIHHEKEKLSIQLAETVKQKALLDQIDFKSERDSVQTGTLVITSEASFLFCVPLGELSYKNKNYTALSIISPIGQVFKGKQLGDSVDFRSKHYKIKAII